MTPSPLTERELALDPRVQQLIVAAVVEAEIEAYQAGFKAGNHEGYAAGRQAGFEDGYAAYEAELATHMPAIPEAVLERNRLWAEYNQAPQLESPEKDPPRAGTVRVGRED